MLVKKQPRVVTVKTCSGEENLAWSVVETGKKPRALITHKSCPSQSFSSKWGSWLNLSSGKGCQESPVRRVMTWAWALMSKISIKFWMCGCQNLPSKCLPGVSVHPYWSNNGNRIEDRQPLPITRIGTRTCLLIKMGRGRTNSHRRETIRVEVLTKPLSKPVLLKRSLQIGDKLWLEWRLWLIKKMKFQIHQNLRMKKLKINRQVNSNKH